MIYRSRDEYRRLGLIHRWNAIATLLLLVTGLLLYAEPLRGVLSPVRVPMKYLHIASGLLLGLWALRTAAEWAGFMRRPGLHRGRRLNTILTVIWLGAWTATGLLMWLRGSVPYETSAIATTLHDWLTWAALPWVTVHVAFRLEKVRRLDERLIEAGERPGGYPRAMADWLAAPATRRAVLWTGFATLGMVLLGRYFRPITPEGLALTDPSDAPVDPKSLPGGGMKGRFRLYFINDVIPKFDPRAWRLTVGEKSYTWTQFQALPRVTYVRNFHCVTGWSVFNITWEGVRLRDILADARMPQSETLVFSSGDGEYTDTLTWEQANDEDVLLAFQMEGRPLPTAQGGPVRLLVPQMYGYKSVKWVERIEATEQRYYLGYWELLGYPVNAYLAKGERTQGGLGPG